MSVVGDIAGIFKRDRWLFLACNVFLFGTFIAGVLAGTAYPGVHDTAAAFVERAASSGPISTAEHTLRSGNILLGTWQIFANNSFITIVIAALPSLLFPPWILFVFGSQFFLFGVVYAGPRALENPVLLLPLLGTLLLEGEGYVIAIFAAMRLIEALVWPGRFGERNPLRAYVAAVVDNAKLLVVAVAVLAVAALYEAASIVLVLGPGK